MTPFRREIRALLDRQPLGLHLTYRCGRTLFVAASHAQRHQFINGRWCAAIRCAACQYFGGH